MWALERLGYDVTLVKNGASLAAKLKFIYNEVDEDFLRVDADVIPNKRCESILFPNGIWWIQGMTYDWYKQDLTNGGIQFIRKEALPILRQNIQRFFKAERPESQMYRLEEFHSPRRCMSSAFVYGLHGFGQKDLPRVKAVKDRRKQPNYDWDLVERLNAY